MYRDREEELQRLQAELLQDQEPETEETDELLDEETLDTLLSDGEKTGNSRIYHNFSNDYGRNLRNYASGYRAYNSDKTDTDLESYSEEIREPKKTRGLWGVAIVLLILAIAAVGVVAWLYLRGLF